MLRADCSQFVPRDTTFKGPFIKSVAGVAPTAAANSRRLQSATTRVTLRVDLPLNSDNSVPDARALVASLKRTMEPETSVNNSLSQTVAALRKETQDDTLFVTGDASSVSVVDSSPAAAAASQAFDVPLVAGAAAGGTAVLLLAGLSLRHRLRRHAAAKPLTATERLKDRLAHKGPSIEMTKMAPPRPPPHADTVHVNPLHVRSPAPRAFRRHREGSAEWFVDVLTEENSWMLPEGGVVEGEEREVLSPHSPYQRVFRRERDGSAVSAAPAHPNALSSPTHRTPPLFFTLLLRAQEWFKDLSTGEDVWELPDGGIVEGEGLGSEPEPPQPHTPPQRLFRRVREGSAEWFVDSTSGGNVWELPADGVVVEDDGAAPTTLPAEGAAAPTEGAAPMTLPAESAAASMEGAAPTTLPAESAAAPASWWLTVRDGDDTWYVHPKTRELVWALPSGAVGVEGIFRLVRDADGSSFYKNTETGQTEWELPPGCVIEESEGGGP